MPRMVPTLVCLSLFLIFAPAALAQSDCGSCQPYYSCDTSCTICDGIENPDGSCSNYIYTTCGDTGQTCGQCTITDTWEEDQEISHQEYYPPFCGHEYYWWGANLSLFVYVTKHMRHVTYGHEICAGQPSTVVLSSYDFDDHCYEFVYPDCCDWRTDPNCPYWYGEDTFDSYMECPY